MSTNETTSTPSVSAVWEPDIAAFEARDRVSPPTPGGIVFVGSSTFTFWESLEHDFDPLNAINRGFGGCQLTDCVAFADRIVIPYTPRQVVLYAGDNDIGGGKEPRDVFHAFHRFADKVHASLPKTMVSYLSIKASVERWPLRAQIMDTNRLIQAYTKDHHLTSFIDTYATTLGDDGLPRPELFIDGLHLNREGYELWIPIINASLIQ